MEQILAETRRLVEPAYRAAVEVLPPEIGHIAGYHAGWWDADGRPCGNAGKAVRPALVLAAARAVTGGLDCAVVESAVAAAVAVELVHDFSLLHDDVMDGDMIRRHRPAAWCVFGVSQAILAGDTLLSLAGDVLAHSPVGMAGMKVLTGAVLELCAGQAADIAFEECTDVSVAECVAMATAKTGALLGAACELGALAGGAGRERAQALRGFGRDVGLAFQLIDDLLGIWGDPRVTGKPAGNDLLARKRSLPVVAALSSGTPAGEHLSWLYQREEVMDASAVVHAANLIEAAGGRAWAQVEADRYTATALHRLDCLDGASTDGADLRLLAHLITRRDH